MARARSVRSLLAELDDLPPGFARTAKAEEAVRAADVAGDLDAGYQARVALASAAEHGGEAQKALVAVTWCLGQIDEHPGRFDIQGPYWALKWLPNTLLDVPTVPLSEVTRVLAEVRRRFEAEGTGHDAVAKLAWTIPLRLGRVEEAVAAHRGWRLVPRTEFGDCRACDVSCEVDLAIAASDPALAVVVARPLLSGHLSCAEEPARVLGALLEPLAGLGEHDEAERLHGWGIRLARGNPSLVSTQAAHVFHLVRTGRLADAQDLVAELVAVCDRGLFDVDARMEVEAAGASVAASLAASGTATLDRPWGNRPRVTLELADRLAADARETAAAFDRRNGTPARSRTIERLLSVRPLPGHTVATATAAAAADLPVPQVTAGPVTEQARPGGGVGDPAALLLRATTTPGLTEDELLELATRAEAAFRDVADHLGAARARRLVGAALLRSDRTDEAIDVLTPAVAALSPDPGEQARAALHLATAWFDRDPSGGEADRWLAAAQDAAGRSAESGILHGRCLVTGATWALARLEAPAGPTDLAAALPTFERARDLMGGEATETAHAWATEAEWRARAGDLDGAVRTAARGWEVLPADEVDDAVGIGALYVGLLTAHEQWDRALDVLSAVRDRATAAGAPAAAARTVMARTDLLVDAGRHDDALASAWEAIDLFRSVGDGPSTDGARLELARLLREMGRDADAHELLAELLAASNGGNDRDFEGALALDLALLELDYDVLDEGLAHAQHALACFETDVPARARVFRALANLHGAAGDWEPALAMGNECVLAFTTEGNPVLLADARQEQAGRLLLAGRPEAALSLYGTVRDAYVEAELTVAAAGADLGRVDALAALGRIDEAVQLAEATAGVGRSEEVPELEADALWAAAVHRASDTGAFDRALAAYERAGAPPEQLDELRAHRDALLKKAGRRSRWRR